MADKKISALSSASTPLAGTEVLPIVQSGSTVKVPVSDLTAGRAISATQVTASTGNFVVGTAGKGIDFSANSGNVLTQYKESTYTPTFTADSGTAPAIGNGTLTGAYTRVGRLIQAEIKIVVGSTTTMGSGGVLQFGLPVAASSSAGATGTAYIDDTGTGWTIGFPTLRTSTQVDISLAVPGTIGTTRVTNAAPMTWATGDSMVISFVYFA